MSRTIQIHTGNQNLITSAASSSYATTASYAVNVPGGIVSSSSQINTGSFTGSFVGSHTGTFPYASLTGVPSGIVSSSGQVSYTGLSNIPVGILSSSTQQVVSTYTNATDNRVLTSTGTGGINAESTLTYDGTVLSISTNGAKYFQGGDDAALYDVNIANTLGIHGQQDSTVGAIKLGSAGQTIYSNATGVGIGTTSPGATLHVQGNVSASSFTGSFSGSITNAVSSSYAVTASYALNSSGGGGSLSGGTANYIPLWTSATAQSSSAIYQSSGNVGIGTTGPGVKLEVAGTIVAGTYNSTRLELTSNGIIQEYYATEANPRWKIHRDLIGSAQPGFGFGDTTGTIDATGAAIGYPGVSRTMAFYTSNATSLVERVRIDGSGNVGIGTTSPGALLHVQGAVSASSYTANGNTVWHAGNDGASSGLDADLLDGQHGSYYTTAGNLSGTIPSSVLGNSTLYVGTTAIALNRASTSQTLTGVSIDGNSATVTNGMYLSGDQNISGVKTFYTPSGQTFNAASGNIGLSVFNPAAGDAMMTFHVSGDWAGYFGLGGAENDLVWTGWSVGNNRYRIWHSGNDGASSGLDADLLDGNHASAFYLASNPSGYTTNTGTVTSVGGTGTVSGLTLSGTVTTTGNLTLGGTLSVAASNFSSQTANTFLAAPNGSAGTPTFRTIVAADIPTLNQNTTGTASFATTSSFATTASFATSASWAPNSGVTLAATSTNATFYPLIYNASTGTTSTLNVDTGWTFNPSTNDMSIPAGITIPGSISAQGGISLGSGASINFNATPGLLGMADGRITRPRLEDYAETYTSPAISGGTLTLNLENGNVFRTTRNANITTLTISNPAANGNACSFTLIFDANGTSYTITWPAAVKWPGGTAPTITTTNGRSDMFVFYTNNAGTTWYAMTAAQDFVTT